MGNDLQKGAKRNSKMSKIVTSKKAAKTSKKEKLRTERDLNA